MKIIEQTEVSIEWSDINKRIRHPLPLIHERAPGVHLSGVLRYVAVKTEMLTQFEVDAEIMPMRMALGMAWEDWVVGLYPKMEWQPGEMERDGVFGNCDGRSFETIPKRKIKREPIIDEFKLTWKSCRMPGSKKSHKDITKEWMWQHQIMGYCAMDELEPRYGRLHVCYINGSYDYFKGGAPRYFRYLMEYSEQEIEANWKMVTKYKDKAVPE